MELKGLFLAFLAIGSAAAQTFKVCITPSSPHSTCQSIETGGSQVTCESVSTRVECALKLASGRADIGYFSSEETLLLSLQHPNDLRVVATVRDVSRMEPVSFEAVAVVPGSHSGGLAGLRGGRYCHPGLDETDQRWSPRVLKALEVAVAQTDRCGDIDPSGKSAEHVEVQTLGGFFSAACRPGPWSAKRSHDVDLKSQNPSLCSLCGRNSSCEGYSLDMGVAVAGARNDNRHIQALECLRVNTAPSTAPTAPTAPAVAYAAWLHVREYFNSLRPQDAPSYSLLCPDGSLQPLTSVVLNNATAPCAFVRQPWATIVASKEQASSVLSSLRSWWPGGLRPPSDWQRDLYTVLAGTEGDNARVVFEDMHLSVSNYTAPIRQISPIESSPSCLPARRWCSLSAEEQSKCTWVRSAAHTLGLQPTFSCQQRPSVLHCLQDIRENRADFIASPSDYGYLARQHYKLSPVKIVENSRAALNNIAAFVKEGTNVTRFENLRGGTACFPEYGGLAYMAFVRAGQETGVLSASSCDYLRAVGELFGAACAPGAEDASHALSDTTYDATNLCSVCTPAAPGGNSSTCAWDYSNKYFGNNGSLACLADPRTDVAFLNTQNMPKYLAEQNLQGSQFRALCRNNTLAARPGLSLDDNCLLALVVDAEVVTRRNDPSTVSIDVLLDSLTATFGYSAARATQHINLEIFSPFDGVPNLLFKDSAIGLSDPTGASQVPAKNYMELFKHLDDCTSAAGGVVGGTAGLSSMLGLVLGSMVARVMLY